MNAREALQQLSRLPEKRARYREEVFFREAWRDLREAAGAGTPELLRSHALVLFKPDGIVARAVRVALEELSTQGFTPVGAHVANLDRLATRWLWLYRFNVASVERVWLHDLINSAGPSLLVVLRDERAVAGDPIPGCVRLTEHKGSSRPERRRPDQLRTLLGVTDRLLNYLHTSDEPADMVRELGILLTESERRTVIDQMIAGEAWPAQVGGLLARLEAGAPARALELDLALAGILERARAGAAGAPSAQERARWSELATHALAMQRGVEGAGESLWRLLRGLAGEVERWDLIALATWVIQHDEPGAAKQVLGDAPPELWRDEGPRPAPQPASEPISG